METFLEESFLSEKIKNKIEHTHKYVINLDESDGNLSKSSKLDRMK